MVRNNNLKQKQKVQPALSTTQGDQNLDLEEYGPIYFHNENEDYGFLSNFYETTFKAPDPATWLFKSSETISSGLSSDNIHAGDERPATLAFRHSEQYYMYCKAIYFVDQIVATEIIGTNSATRCKSFGRFVKGFSDKAWEKHNLKVRVVEEALWWKFGGGQLEESIEDSNNIPTGQRLRTKEDRFRAVEGLGKQLLATGERQLVEAAGRDRYWGIGYRLKDGPHLWQENWGRNQLGKSLMTVRGRLRRLVNGDKDDAQAE